MSGGMAEWFTRHLSRRTLGKGMAWGALLGMAGVTTVKLVAGDEREASFDSLDLQRREGWDVGANGEQFDQTVGSLHESAVDSLNRSWQGGDPNYLLSVYQPRAEAWRPFFVPTLLQSLTQSTLAMRIQPFHSTEMDEARRQAEGLRSLLQQAPDAGRTMIVADLPGPLSMSVGAALSDVATIVPMFDNWPHPHGVVPAHETLGAMIYYAREIEGKRASLAASAPVLLTLDSRRLSPYTDSAVTFDNRYLAKMPEAGQLRERGIERAIYLVKDEVQQNELDDLNEEMVAWERGGIDVRMLRLSDFRPDQTRLSPSSTGTGVQAVHHHYYGGSLLSHFLFFSHYGLRTPANIGVVRNTGRVAANTVQPPAWRPVSRPTIFTSSRVGGASGVGRAKPSGFGRTSVRISNSGEVLGTRPGRSGSYGRGGGWFGG